MYAKRALEESPMLLKQDPQETNDAYVSGGRAGELVVGEEVVGMAGAGGVRVQDFCKRRDCAKRTQCRYLELEREWRKSQAPTKRCVYARVRACVRAWFLWSACVCANVCACVGMSIHVRAPRQTSACVRGFYGALVRARMLVRAPRQTRTSRGARGDHVAACPPACTPASYLMM